MYKREYKLTNVVFERQVTVEDTCAPTGRNRDKATASRRASVCVFGVIIVGLYFAYRRRSLDDVVVVVNVVGDDGGGTVRGRRGLVLSSACASPS